MKKLPILLLVLLAACEKKPTTVTQTVEIPTAAPAVRATATPQPTPPPVVIYRLVNVELRPEWTTRLDTVIAGIVRDKDRYAEVQAMRNNGVPWFIVGGLHERESSRSFAKHLHEGSPLLYRTRYIPKNRLISQATFNNMKLSERNAFIQAGGKIADPPYTWPQSSEDALYVLKREDKVDWRDTDKALNAIEAYNGWGYRDYHPDVKSPYLWSGTTQYARGKYTADSKFDRLAVDKQAGVAALWARMEQRGLLSE